MSMSSIHYELERIRETEGEEAYNRACHGVIGATWGAGGGAIAGATIGSVVPVVGTVVGGVIGAGVGLMLGAQDETLGDNARTGLTCLKRAMGWWSSH